MDIEIFLFIQINCFSLLQATEWSFSIEMIAF